MHRPSQTAYYGGGRPSQTESNGAVSTNQQRVAAILAGDKAPTCPLQETCPLGRLRRCGPIVAIWNEDRTPTGELTAGQQEVLDVLSTELASSRPMHRMLQGEVGSGKTIVSVVAMLQMVDAGFQ